MADYNRPRNAPPPGPTQRPRPPGQDCPPATTPADQPKAPSGECEERCPVAKPVLDEPEKCPDPPCHCPPGPTSTTSCLEDLATEETIKVTAGERAKPFKDELVKLIDEAKAAQLLYTQEKYQTLRQEWRKLDTAIVDAIRKLVCTFPCWRCLIECHICPLIYAIRSKEQKLLGGGRLYAEVHSLYDLRYWHERNRDARKAKLDRIGSVLTAWKTPAQTIERILGDNAKIVQAASQTPEALYDIFLRVVPLHLAIAPPAERDWITGIDKQYTDFCPCDDGDPDDCCGPDVGRYSLRQRLAGPQPYLIHPNKYFDIICCLAKQRYLPAKNAWVEAVADWDAVDAEIKRLTAEADPEKLKSFEKEAKAALPKKIDCETYEKEADEPANAGKGAA